MANGEVLTHQSDSYEDVTAGPREQDGMGCRIVHGKRNIRRFLTHHFNTLLLQASVCCEERGLLTISWWLGEEDGLALECLSKEINIK